MKDLINRVRDMINSTYLIFSEKVGSGLLNINKEASMQLQYAYLLLRNKDALLHETDEFIEVELETGIAVNGHNRECDIVVYVSKNGETKRIPIELKCYRNIASSGKNRGAHDTFRYTLYQDLELLENYVSGNTLLGYQLTMIDVRNFAYPRTKKAKSWAYDISHGHEILNGIHINVPIGGDDDASVHLEKSYSFSWNEIGNFYFINLKGE